MTYKKHYLVIEEVKKKAWGPNQWARHETQPRGPIVVVGYVVRCRCGWSSRMFSTQGGTVMAQQEHLRYVERKKRNERGAQIYQTQVVPDHLRWDR